MRSFEYEVLPGMGPGGQKTPGTLKNLVLAIPSLVVSGLIPPFDVVSAVLKTGLQDAGMSGGCSWRPFEISPEEYKELVDSLVAEHGHKPTDAPDWVKTNSDWVIWVLKLIRGVPVDEHRRLTEEYERLIAERKAAGERGESELAEALFVDEVRAGQRLADFVMASTRNPTE